MPRAASNRHTASDTPRGRKSVTCLNSFGRRDRVSEGGTRSHGNTAHPHSVENTVAADPAGVSRGWSRGPRRAAGGARAGLPEARARPTPRASRDRVARELLDAALRPLTDANHIAAPASAQVFEHRAELVEARPEHGEQPVEIAIWHGRGAAICAAAGGLRVSRPDCRRRPLEGVAGVSGISSSAAACSASASMRSAFSPSGISCPLRRAYSGSRSSRG